MIEKIKKKYIGTGAFYRRYLYLALPMIVQNAITNLVSFLDNIMVGQLGTEQMSGVAIVNQLIFVYNLAIFGAASAASIFGAQYFGKGDHKGHMYSFRFKLYATLLVTFATIVLFITKGSDLISLYLTDTAGNGATDVALHYGMQYITVMMVGLIPFAVNQSYATNIKETGQTVIPMIASFVAVGTNAVLDLLLIFGIGPFPKLGVIGAALATVLSQACSCIWVLAFLCGKKTHLRLKGKNMVLQASIIWPSIALGTAMFIMQASESVISVCFNSSLLRYGGDMAVGAMTILTSVMQFALLPLQGLGQGAQPIISYNYGAKRADRVKEAYFLLLKIDVGFSFVLWALVMAFPRAFAAMFTSDAALIAYTGNALRIYLMAIMIFGIQMACQMAFTSLGKAVSSIIVAVMRKFVLLLPLIYIMPHIFTGNQAMAVYMAEPVADVLAVSFTSVLFYFQFRKVLRQIEE